MNHSYFLAGTKLNNFFKLLYTNKALLPAPRYVLRYLFLLQNGVWASFFAAREKKKYKKVINQYPLPDNPIIIVGHWRSGSTYLHQLMAADPQLYAPTVFNISVPEGFMVSEKYYRPIMSKVIKSTRPMDNVKSGFYEPQEEEYALLKTPGLSPLEKLIFTNNHNFFLKDFETFMPDKKHEKLWKLKFGDFIKKNAFVTGKRIVLKNPFHSMRIPLLKEMFPNALFIHIYRNPEDVIPSTANMWNIVGKQNRLKGKWLPPSYDELIQVMDKLLTTLRRDLGHLDNNQYIEVKFEDLENNPVAALENIYKHFYLTISQPFKDEINRFLSHNKNYKKNNYPIEGNVKNKIRNNLHEHMAHYGYL